MAQKKLLDFKSFDYDLLSGDENFTLAGVDQALNMKDFWSYQYSNIWDIASDIAEYIVGKALGLPKPTNRNGWTLYDIDYNGHKIEVKQSQKWHPWNEDGHQSNPVFGITKAHVGYQDSSTEMQRHCDVYVFCVLKGSDKESSNPLVLEHWDFYIVPRQTIDEVCQNNKSISLGRIESMGYSATSFENIKLAIDKVLNYL